MTPREKVLEEYAHQVTEPLYDIGRCILKDGEILIIIDRIWCRYNLTWNYIVMNRYGNKRTSIKERDINLVSEIVAELKKSSKLEGVK